jgi:hypothetical protein
VQGVARQVIDPSARVHSSVDPEAGIYIGVEIGDRLRTEEHQLAAAALRSRFDTPNRSTQRFFLAGRCQARPIDLTDFAARIQAR